MSLKYTDKVEINRQKEIDAYREDIIETLEKSKKLAEECNNLVKLRALKSRCDKISKPRPSSYNEDKKANMKKRYDQNKDKYLSTKREKRQKIRNVGQVDIGNFFGEVPV